MTLLHSTARSFLLLVVVAVSCLNLSGCTGSDDPSDTAGEDDTVQLADRPRRYSASWLIDSSALDMEVEVGSPFLYQEVVDDRTGSYLVVAPNHLALQQPEEVLFCAAISRVPLDPYCASSPRAEGTPNVLSYPIQIIRRDWTPTALYDLAGYREVSLVAASDPDAWSTQLTTATAGFAIECFLVTGETSAAATGFEICFTDDDLHLVASVDLQNDLLFEIELVSYRRTDFADDFETGLDEFVEERPNLQEQLLALYPDIPVARAAAPEAPEE